jgi:hypothetical protein
MPNTIVLIAVAGEAIAPALMRIATAITVIAVALAPIAVVLSAIAFAIAAIAVCARKKPSTFTLFPLILYQLSRSGGCNCGKSLVPISA